MSSAKELLADARRRSKPAALTVAASLAFGSVSSHADELSDLRDRLDAQEQQIRVLERRLELSGEIENRPETPAPVGEAKQKRSAFQIADGEDVLRLRGVLQFDGRRFLDDFAPVSADTWLLRRVRPSLEGTLNGIFDFRFTASFAGGPATIVNASLAAHLRPWATITAGKFKMLVGLGRLAAASDLRFMEHAFPTSLVPNFGVGVQVSGDAAGGAIDYSVGYFNAAGDGGGSDDNALADDASDSSGDFAARVFFQPFLNLGDSALHGLGFGVAGTYAELAGGSAATLLPAYRTPGQRVFFRYRAGAAAGDLPATDGAFANGDRLRVSPQVYYYLRRVGLIGEYVRLFQDVTRVTATGGVRTASLEHAAWQLQLAWFLTGENQAFGGVAPTSEFSLEDKTWGAFELVARAHVLDIDDAVFDEGFDSFANPTSASSRASAWGVGINWYLNENYKWSLNYDVTRFDGGAGSGDHPREHALFTRFAVQF